MNDIIMENRKKRAESMKKKKKKENLTKIIIIAVVLCIAVIFIAIISKDGNNSEPVNQEITTTEAPFVFSQQNILQVKADESDDYISGEWYNLSNGDSEEYKHIQTAGCGIVSLVSSVYNLDGVIKKEDIYNIVDEIFDWAYENELWDNRTLWPFFPVVDEQFGEKYGFETSEQFGGFDNEISLEPLVKHIQSGGTAIVHVLNHFMVIADCKTENGKTYLRVFDPSPGMGTYHDSVNRNGITSPEGNWFSVEDLTNDGGVKGYTDTVEHKYENIEIDGFWLVSKK